MGRVKERWAAAHEEPEEPILDYYIKAAAEAWDQKVDQGIENELADGEPCERCKPYWTSCRCDVD